MMFQHHRFVKRKVYAFVVERVVVFRDQVQILGCEHQYIGLPLAPYTSMLFLATPVFR